MIIDTETPTATPVVEAMAALSDSLRMAAEVANGHRMYLLNHGWPEAIADQLAGGALVLLQGMALGTK